MMNTANSMNVAIYTKLLFPMFWKEGKMKKQRDLKAGYKERYIGINPVL